MGLWVRESADGSRCTAGSGICVVEMNPYHSLAITIGDARDVDCVRAIVAGEIKAQRLE